MNEQQNFWANDYAQDYIKKNSQWDRDLGVEGWRKMLAKTEGIYTVLECGCNIGRNMDLLTTALPTASKSVIEISKPAFDIVTHQYTLDNAFNGAIEDSDFSDKFDLVFTMGVLIHIRPDNLILTMRRMFEYSSKYILMGEYFNRTPVMLEYHGQKDRLFKRDFGKNFIENFPVELVEYGFLWGHIYDTAGFDDITWWLFKKK